MAYGFTKRQAAEYDRWKTTAPEKDSCYCPLCGEAIVEHEDGFKCTNDRCNWSTYPDYPDL